MAKAGDSAPVAMNFIAAEAKVPRKFLELILTDLRQAGLVVSFRGKMGGFRLARPPHLIYFGEIIRTIEGPLALVPCVSRTAYRPCNNCEDEATCALRSEEHPSDLPSLMRISYADFCLKTKHKDK